MTKKSDLQDAARILRENTEFLIVGHTSPDGDSLGCICALTLALRKLGKSVVPLSPDGVPDLYKFLPGSEHIVVDSPPNRRYDMGIVVDCESPDRLGAALPVLSQCKTVLEIDHHPGGDRVSNLQLVDRSAAASGEIVLELLNEAGITITRDIAECLLTAIVTDTGSFRYSNVTPATLRAAASLVEVGVSLSKIAHKIYEARSLSSLKLLGLSLSTLSSTANGRIVYACVMRDHLASSKAAEAETEGIVNYVRSVRGAQIGILFHEGANGTTRVSIRSRDGLDVSQIARMFGGGGHRAAAGCTVEYPLPEAIELVLDAVRKWMGS